MTRFEALCTGSSTVDATSEFCSIVRLKLGQHSVFMGAEIDACDPDSRGTSSGGLQEYVEMKTYKCAPVTCTANPVGFGFSVDTL